jgi:hypothetical protein
MPKGLLVICGLSLLCVPRKSHEHFGRSCAYDRTGTVPTEPPAIEVLKSESFIANADEGTSGPSSTAKATEGAGAVLDEDVGPLTAIIKPRYGFNQQYSGVFGNLREEMLEVIHVQDPDNVPDSQYEKVRRPQHMRPGDSCF